MSGPVADGIPRMVGETVAAVLFVIGCLHVLWAFGWRSGSVVTIPSDGGRPLFQPSMLATLVVAGLLFAAVFVVLGRLGIWGSILPRWPFVAGTWTLVVVFGARVIGDFRWIGLFKRVSTSDFAYWDTRLFVPLCAVLAIGCAIVASSGSAIVEQAKPANGVATSGGGALEQIWIASGVALPPISRDRTVSTALRCVPARSRPPTARAVTVSTTCFRPVIRARR